MKKITVFAVMIFILTDCSQGRAGVSVIFNGGFEKNGQINNIVLKSPRRWPDVNVPADKFSGWVSDEWASADTYSLSLSSNTEELNQYDEAEISQQVYMADAKKIIFDLKLSSAWSFFPWDADLRTALVKLNGQTIWDSNGLQLDGNDEYDGQIQIDIEGLIEPTDTNSYPLSLVLRVNQDGEAYTEYFARWDSVRLDSYNEGTGRPDGDIYADYAVDINDLDLFAGQWLAAEPNDRYDLYPDDSNCVNFCDFAVLADNWMIFNYGPLLDADLNDDGIVNGLDFAILANQWMWQGPSLEADIDESATGIVNTDDLAVMAEQWLQKSWLAGSN